MAIRLKYCSVIIPIAIVEEKLGKGTFKDRYAINLDDIYHDDWLYREGCMDDYVLASILDEWEGHGLELIEVIDGQKHWKDLCVANSHYGPSYPCSWIEYDKDRNIVWLKGTEPGPIVGPLAD